MPSTHRQVRSQTPIVVSAIVNSYRTTGNIMDTGSALESGAFTYFDTSMVTMDHYDSLIQTAYNQSGLDRIGAISMDGLFVGYTTDFDYSGVLPNFTRPTNTGSPNSISLNPFNPDGKFGDRGIVATGSQAGAITGVFNTGVWGSGGHTIRTANTLNQNTSVAGINSGEYSIHSTFDVDFYARQKTELQRIRSVAHRVPMVAAGWGSDTNGNMVPSGEGGSGLHPNALIDPSLWKVGPIDFRWSEERGVWIVGSEGSQIIAFNIVSSDPTVRSALVSIKQRSFLGQVYGSILGDTVVTVYDTDGCFLNEPNVDLTARRGKATLMYTDDESIALHFSGVAGTGASPTGVPEKYWMVTSICCPSVECD